MASGNRKKRDKLAVYLESQSRKAVSDRLKLVESFRHAPKTKEQLGMHPAHAML